MDYSFMQYLFQYPYLVCDNYKFLFLLPYELLIKNEALYWFLKMKADIEVEWVVGKWE